MISRVRGKPALAILITMSLALGMLFALAVIFTPLPAPQKLETTEIFDSNSRLISRVFTENRIEIPVVEMPKSLLDAIVAIEDDRFYRHRGIDPIGIVRAAYRNIRSGRILEGGSTLTQQLARNLYLSQERTFTRKLREAVLTLKLESTYSKKEILGMYWNTIYLGQGAYGIEVASQTYFGKPARKLTLAEAALLAGLPRAPEFYAPSLHPDEAVRRRNLVLKRMEEQGYIDASEASAAQSERLSVVKTNSFVALEAPYFVDYLAKELQLRAPERFSRGMEELYRGGYRIYTTLNPEIQHAAEVAIARLSPQGAANSKTGYQPEVALAAIDPATGYVRALIGGREREVRRNRVLERRQPGSAFKPFVYATALETYSYTAASTQLDAPVEFPGAVEGQSWRPQNFQGNYSGKPATMREALRKSLNVVTARWMDRLKPGPVVSLAKRMGIESAMPDNLTIGLGSAEVTPLELTRAYSPFANGGFAVQLIAVLRVEDRHGTVLFQQGASRKRAIDPGIAFIMSDMLKDVLRPGGTAANVAGYLGGRPAAGKTGTTDESRDAWFVGYTPELVASVWVGNDDRTEGESRTGGSAAAPIWGDFMSQALADRSFRDWVPPTGVVRQDVCSLTGLRPNVSCPVDHEWFLQGTAPIQVDPTVHWDHLMPELPGTPWVPTGTLPPGITGPSGRQPSPTPPNLPVPFPFPQT